MVRKSTALEAPSMGTMIPLILIGGNTHWSCFGGITGAHVVLSVAEMIITPASIMFCNEGLSW